MFRLFLILSGLLIAEVTQGQDFWRVLAKVEFKKQKAGFSEMEIPVFSAEIKSWQGKKIRLKGFLIPVSESGDNRYMFSALPFSVCYFCGAAGPETVVELDHLKLNFTMDAIWVEGILNLNDQDPDHHIYILKSVTRIEP